MEDDGCLGDDYGIYIDRKQWPREIDSSNS